MRTAGAGPNSLRAQAVAWRGDRTTGEGGRESEGAISGGRGAAAAERIESVLLPRGGGGPALSQSRPHPLSFCSLYLIYLYLYPLGILSLSLHLTSPGLSLPSVADFVQLATAPKASAPGATPTRNLARSERCEHRPHTWRRIYTLRARLAAGEAPGRPLPALRAAAPAGRGRPNSSLGARQTRRAPAHSREIVHTPFGSRPSPPAII